MLHIYIKVKHKKKQTKQIIIMCGYHCAKHCPSGCQDYLCKHQTFHPQHCKRKCGPHCSKKEVPIERPIDLLRKNLRLHRKQQLQQAIPLNGHYELQCEYCNAPLITDFWYSDSEMYFFCDSCVPQHKLDKYAPVVEYWIHRQYSFRCGMLHHT